MSAHAIITLARYYDQRLFQSLHARLRPDGTLWLFAECPNVEAWQMAFALQRAGWILRSDIVWTGFTLPALSTDVPVRAHQFIFLLALESNYYFDATAIREDGVTGAWSAMPPIGGVKHVDGNDNQTYSGNRPASDGRRNRRDVWSMTTANVISLAVQAGAPEGATVIMPATLRLLAGCETEILGRKVEAQ